MEYFGISDIGKIRTINEDCYYADGNLFIIADGMGGHNAGEIASSKAIEFFLNSFRQIVNSKFNEKTIDTKKQNLTLNYAEEKLLIDFSEDEIQKSLKKALKIANKKLYKLSLENEEYSGMGTTFTSLFVNNNIGYVIHVGDSRLYLSRENELNLLTEDHTLVFQLYKNGIISYEETFSHPQRNYLTSVIGENEIPALESLKFYPKDKDIILLCSDGLNSMLEDFAIKKIIDKNKNYSSEKIANSLLSEALKNGGYDNITIIIIKI